jgi:hypothetical protein
MHENMIGGAMLTNWLAIVGVISLIYWAWRIFAAFQHRGSGGQQAAGAPAARAPVLAPAQPVQLAPPAEDIAVIAAAVYAMLGAHRIVHLEAIGPDRIWAAEGRWRQQTSHTPR